MLFKITGYRFGSFTDDNGKRINYSTLFVPIQIAESVGENGSYSDGYYTQKISVGRIISADDVEKIVNGSRHVDIEFDCFGKVTTCYVVDDNK